MRVLRLRCARTAHRSHAVAAAIEGIDGLDPQVRRRLRIAGVLITDDRMTLPGQHAFARLDEAHVWRRALAFL